MYISSADFMTRNTERRVEVACPIVDERVKAKVHKVLDACLADNVKGRILQADAVYTEVPQEKDDKKIDCQQLLMSEAIEAAAQPKEEVAENFRKTGSIAAFFKKLFTFSAF